MNEIATPLFKEIKYSGKVSNCDKNGFIFQQEVSSYSMKLFNIMMSEKGKKKACELLEQAKFVEIEIDRNAPSIYVTEVYAFVEGKLVQEYLIENDFARIKLRNPEYKYFQDMIEAGIDEVSGDITLTEPARTFDRTRANQFFFVQFFVIFLVALFMILRKIIKKMI